MTAEKPARTPPSRLERLPLLLLPALALVFVFTEPESTGNRLAWWIGLALVPGALLRLAGRPSWKTHRVFFALGLLCFMLADPRLRPGASDFANVLHNWPAVLLGMVFCLSQPLWGALRLGLLLNDSAGRVPFSHSLRLCLVGTFFNIFLPGATGGDVYRVYAISRGEHRGLASSLATVTLDRFLGLPPLIAVILAASFLDADFFAAGVPARLGTFIAITAVAALILTLCLLFNRRLAAGAGGEPGPAWGRLKRLRWVAAKHIVRKRTLPLVLLAGLASHVSLVIACMAFGRAAGVEGVSPLRHFLVVPLSMAANSIPGAPGGIGQGELAMAALFDLAAPGMGNAQAGVLAMLLLRLGNILSGLVGGAVFAGGGGSPLDEAGRLGRIEAER